MSVMAERTVAYMPLVRPSDTRLTKYNPARTGSSSTLASSVPTAETMKMGRRPYPSLNRPSSGAENSCTPRNTPVPTLSHSCGCRSPRTNSGSTGPTAAPTTTSTRMMA